MNEFEVMVRRSILTESLRRWARRFADVDVRREILLANDFHELFKIIVGPLVGEGVSQFRLDAPEATQTLSGVDRQQPVSPPAA